MKINKLHLTETTASGTLQNRRLANIETGESHTEGETGNDGLEDITTIQVEVLMIEAAVVQQRGKRNVSKPQSNAHQYCQGRFRAWIDKKLVGCQLCLSREIAGELQL